MLGVVDAAYGACGRSELEWLDELASATSGLFDDLGVFAYTFGTVDRRFTLGKPVGRDVNALTMATFAIANHLSTRRALARAYRAPHISITLSEYMGEGKLARNPVALTYGPLSGIADFLVVKAVQPTGDGVAIGVPLSRECLLAPSTKQSLGLMAAHVAAAWRLREAKGDRNDGLPPGTEAVIRPGRGVVHAEKAATQSRALLSETAKRIDCARARSNDERTLEVWPALLEGRWSISEHFEHDSSRFFLARRNEPGATQSGHVLSKQERQVAALMALGHSHKLIGYELGISVSSVATIERRAMKKLGLSSRLALVALGAALFDGRPATR